MADDSREVDLVSAAVGTRIRSIRKAKGLTQVEVSMASMIDQPFLSRIERGEQNLELRTMVRVARSLGCTLEDMVRDVEV